MATGRIGVTPTLGTRWSKAPSAGTTSLSGLDDSSVSLVYSVGYEQVYRNGVLLSRGNDYTATSGNSITLTDATVNGDIIEVFANELVPLTDAISKGQFTAKGSLLSASAASTPAVLAVGSNNQVLTADSSTSTGLKWATPSAGALTKISSTTFSNVATQDIDNVFTSTYDTYLVIIKSLYAATASDDAHLQFRYSTSTQTSAYWGAGDYVVYTPSSTLIAGGSVNQMILSNNIGSSTSQGMGSFYVNFADGGGSPGRAAVFGKYYTQNDAAFTDFGWDSSSTQTWTGMRFKSSSTNISGTIVIYGLEK